MKTERRKKMYNTNKIYMLVATMIFLYGCEKSSNGNSGTIDATSRDMDPNINKARINLYITNPLPLGTMFLKDGNISLECKHYQFSKKDVMYAIQKNIKLMSASDKKVLPVTWGSMSQLTNNCKTSFKPNSLLVDGIDYYVELFENDGIVLDKIWGRKKVYFRTDSMPRVVSIHIAEKNLSSKVEKISLQFSEMMNGSSIASSVVLTEKGKSTPLNISPIAFKSTTTTIAYTINNPIASTIDLNVLVKSSAFSETGKKLDGKYIGISGSGDFQAEIDLNKYTGQYWFPDVKIGL
jgi:hypothetical protein